MTELPHEIMEVPDNLLGIIPNDDATPLVPNEKRKKKSKVELQLDEGKVRTAPGKKKKHDSLYQLQMPK